MNKHIALGALIVGLLAFFFYLHKPKITSNPTKKILILSSNGGGGQSIVSTAFINDLGNEYTVASVNYFSTVLSTVDAIKYLTFGLYDSEDFLNYAAQKCYFKLLENSYYASRWYYGAASPLIINQTKNLILKEKPDLVISLIPIFNNMIAKSCKKTGTPFLLIPLDLDISFYTRDIKKPYNKELYVALPFDNTLSRESMAQANIPSEKIFSFAYPLRADFYEQKDISALKKQYHINDDKPVICTIMGSLGNSGSYVFAKELAQLDVPAHIIMCIGRNKKAKKQIESLSFPSHITPHIVEYTDRMSDIMAITDILITKTGALSIMEALRSNVSIIADQIYSGLPWEGFHPLFLEKHNCGLLLKNIKDLNPMVKNLIMHPDKTLLLQNNCKKIINEQPTNNIRPIIEAIIAQNTQNKACL